MEAKSYALISTSIDVVETTIVAEPDFELEGFYLFKINQQNPVSIGMAYDKKRKFLLAWLNLMVGLLPQPIS